MKMENNPIIFRSYPRTVITVQKKDLLSDNSSIIIISSDLH